MVFNLKEKCFSSKKKEFYYGAKIEKRIKDVYLGTGMLGSMEKNRKIGPGRGHEEILYITKGKVEVKFRDTNHILTQGQLVFLPDNSKVRLTNLTDDVVEFIIAGGHTKFHKH